MHFRNQLNGLCIVYLSKNEELKVVQFYFIFDKILVLWKF
jgi:hypothetical protein